MQYLSIHNIENKHKVETNLFTEDIARYHFVFIIFYLGIYISIIDSQIFKTPEFLVDLSSTYLRDMSFNTLGFNHLTGSGDTKNVDLIHTTKMVHYLVDFIVSEE